MPQKVKLFASKFAFTYHERENKFWIDSMKGYLKTIFNKKIFLRLSTIFVRYNDDIVTDTSVPLYIY